MSILWKKNSELSSFQRLTEGKVLRTQDQNSTIKLGKIKDLVRSRVSPKKSFSKPLKKYLTKIKVNVICLEKLPLKIVEIGNLTKRELNEKHIKSAKIKTTKAYWIKIIWLRSQTQEVVF